MMIKKILPGHHAHVLLLSFSSYTAFFIIFNLNNNQQFHEATARDATRNLLSLLNNSQHPHTHCKTWRAEKKDSHAIRCQPVQSMISTTICKSGNLNCFILLVEKWVSLVSERV